MCVYVFRSDFYMGRMQIVLTADAEDKLRKKAYAEFGLKKGSISKAVQKAIELWIKEK